MEPKNEISYIPGLIKLIEILHNIGKKDPNQLARQIAEFPKKLNKSKDILKKGWAYIDKWLQDNRPPSYSFNWLADKTAVKLPELEDILSPPIPVNESQPWGIPKYGLIGIPSGISNKSQFQDKGGSGNAKKGVISKDRFKPLLPKLPVRIRGLDELYKKIEPVKIDYDKYLIKPAEETVSSFIKPIGSGLKSGLLESLLSFLPDKSRVSLPLGKLVNSGLFKSMRGLFGMGGNNVFSTLGMFLGGKDKLLGRLLGKDGLFEKVPNLDQIQKLNFAACN